MEVIESTVGDNNNLDIIKNPYFLIRRKENIERGVLCVRIKSLYPVWITLDEVIDIILDIEGERNSEMVKSITTEKTRKCVECNEYINKNEECLKITRSYIHDECKREFKSTLEEIKEETYNLNSILTIQNL